MCDGSLPPDFKEYLATTNGMAYGECDENVLSFWPVETILSRSSLIERGADGMFVPFADYLISSHFYCLQIDGDCRDAAVVVADGTNSKQIAPSFAAFLSAYLDNRGVNAISLRGAISSRAGF